MIKNIISDIGNVIFEFDTSGFIDKNIEAEEKEKGAGGGAWCQPYDPVAYGKTPERVRAKAAGAGDQQEKERMIKWN